MTGDQAARWIDADRLPEDVRSLIRALRPGEDLRIVSDGTTIATISGAAVAFHAGISDPGASGRGSFPEENVTLVATAMKLSASARVSLSAQLGPDYLVLDLHSAPESVDVLLIPPVSPQLIASLRAKFPKARVVIAEIEDQELGISYEGPLRRLLDAGADTYLPAGTIPQLAGQLDRTLTRLNQVTGPAPLTIESPPDLEPRKGNGPP
ncbi:hypothetical protein [Amycolatopsis saalfeldensis]|uniref:Uncharacterized protein n=1 Tax=Amycolatopsis saalfeldensis TaxID=394193 RepID=A0A1H8XEE1_9PSEU|nr:hypothetical protein [Amycolatopsis saalfeldensis]SEP38213.1 hypothetical protein SAMN04489732_107128 [Amycolatopsis saalfeldensis]